MSKSKTEDQIVDTEAEAEVPAEPKSDKRYKAVTTPEGETVKRTDYIRRLWATGSYTRGEIRDHLKNECTSEDGAHDIAYQIVFAATKDHEGGPSEEQLAERKAAKEAAKAEKVAAAKAEKAAEKAAEAEAEATSAEGESA